MLESRDAARLALALAVGQLVCGDGAPHRLHPLVPYRWIPVLMLTTIRRTFGLMDTCSQPFDWAGIRSALCVRRPSPRRRRGLWASPASDHRRIDAVECRDGLLGPSIGFWTLFASRVAAGIGEATLTPAGYSLWAIIFRCAD